jgi:hypothetical protein
METVKIISVIGFVSHVGIDYYFNRWDNSFDNSGKIDFSEDAWKYEGASMESAQACFEKEGCIGKLEVMEIEL